jgi:hypothetical protein
MFESYMTIRCLFSVRQGASWQLEGYILQIYQAIN